MASRSFLVIGVVAAAVCLFVGAALAQDPTGTLEGQITDPSGAVVSGAKVTVRDAQTGLTRTVRAPFQQLNPATQAGQFGNEGRNVARGPGIESVDLSLFKNFGLGETRRLQFRAECFNLLNHANLRVPENDLGSPAFGQILQARGPRLLQLALKVVF